jgi:hypothetical protein
VVGVSANHSTFADGSNYFRNDTYSKLRAQHNFEARGRARSVERTSRTNALTLRLMRPPSCRRTRFRNSNTSEIKPFMVGLNALREPIPGLYRLRDPLGAQGRGRRGTATCDQKDD